MLRYSLRRFTTTYTSSSVTSKSILKNSGSTARDQLANERTCLAFLRTGLSFMGAGIALWTAYCFAYDAHDPTSVHPSEIIPAVGGFMLNGFIFSFYSIRRFGQLQRLLLEGQFKLAKGDLMFVLLASLGMNVLILWYVYNVEMKHKPTSDAALEDMAMKKRHVKKTHKEEEVGK